MLFLLFEDVFQQDWTRFWWAIVSHWLFQHCLARIQIKVPMGLYDRQIVCIVKPVNVILYADDNFSPFPLFPFSPFSSFSRFSNRKKFTFYFWLKMAHNLFEGWGRRHLGDPHIDTHCSGFSCITTCSQVISYCIHDSHKYMQSIVAKRGVHTPNNYFTEFSNLLVGHLLVNFIYVTQWVVNFGRVVLAQNN